MERFEELYHREEYVYVGNPSREDFQLFASCGGFHILDSLGFDKIKINSFMLTVNPKIFLHKHQKNISGGSSASCIVCIW